MVDNSRLRTFFGVLIRRVYIPRLSVLGLVLFICFLLQAVLNLKFPFLEALQRNELYKQISGFFLLGFLIIQWYLSFLRVRSNHHAAKKQFTLHKQIGTFAPLVFYIHSTKWGYAYLSFLSAVYFANFLVGIFNPEAIFFNPRLVKQGWRAIHVGLSVLVLVIAIYHLAIAFTYH